MDALLYFFAGDPLRLWEITALDQEIVRHKTPLKWQIVVFTLRFLYGLSKQDVLCSVDFVAFEWSQASRFPLFPVCMLS